MSRWVALLAVVGVLSSCKGKEDAEDTDVAADSDVTDTEVNDTDGGDAEDTDADDTNAGDTDAGDTDAGDTDVGPAVPRSISIDFADSGATEAPLSAGSPTTEGWNLARGAGPSEGDGGGLDGLLDETGTATAVSVEWSCQDIELTTISGGPSGDHSMMYDGCRSWQGNGDGTVTLSGLSAVFPDGWQAVVYVGRGGGFPADHSASFTLTMGSTTLTGKVLPTFDGTWNPLDGGDDAGNVATFGAMTEDEVTITIAATGGATLPTAAINGIAIFPASDL